MKKILTMIILIFATISSAQELENFQFSDLDGNTYDLYEVLDRGTYIYIHAVSSG